MLRSHCVFAFSTTFVLIAAVTFGAGYAGAAELAVLGLSFDLFFQFLLFVSTPYTHDLKEIVAVGLHAILLTSLVLASMWSYKSDDTYALPTFILVGSRLIGQMCILEEEKEGDVQPLYN